MTKTLFGFAAAAVISVASFSAPAMAFTAKVPAMTSSSHIVAVRHVMRHRPVCVVRTVVKRGPHGRRVVSKVRTCR